MLKLNFATAMILALGIISGQTYASDGSFAIEGQIINGTCKVEGVVVNPPYGGTGVPTKNIVIEAYPHLVTNSDEANSYFVRNYTSFRIRLTDCAATAIRPRFTTSGSLDDKGRLINMNKNGPQNISITIAESGSGRVIRFNETTDWLVPPPSPTPGNVDFFGYIYAYKTGDLPADSGPIYGLINYEMEYF